VPAIVQGITLNWSLSPGTAGTISASVNQATVSWNTSFTGYFGSVLYGVKQQWDKCALNIFKVNVAVAILFI